MHEREYLLAVITGSLLANMDLWTDTNIAVALRTAQRIIKACDPETPLPTNHIFPGGPGVA